MCSYKFQSKQHLLWENKWFSEKQLPCVLEEFLANTKTWAFILKLNILNNYEMRLLPLSESRTEREKVKQYNIKCDIYSRTIIQQHNNKLKLNFPLKSKGQSLWDRSRRWHHKALFTLSTPTENSLNVQSFTAQAARPWYMTVPECQSV